MIDQYGVWSGIHVVCGFSCAGKSTYIEHLLTGTSPYHGATAVFATMFRTGERKTLLPGDVFHLDISNESLAPAGPGTWHPKVTHHPLMAANVFEGGVTSVDFLILPERNLRRRIAARTQYGHDIGRPPRRGTYPRERKLRILDRCPLVDRYAAWMDYFEAGPASVRYIHSGDRRYREIPTRTEALRILAGKRARKPWWQWSWPGIAARPETRKQP